MAKLFKIVLDPGHGGNTLVEGSSPNNAAAPNGLLEKDLTLKIAQIVSEKLPKNQFQTFLTRDKDVNLSLKQRAGKSREVGADAFVSIHFNASKKQGFDGTEVFISESSDEKDYLLAEQLLRNVSSAASIGKRGIREVDFTVLKGKYHVAKTAACLVEMAYLTNPTQAKNLSSPAYLDKLASAVTQAIVNYTKQSSYTQSLADEKQVFKDDEINFNITEPTEIKSQSFGLDNEFDSSHFESLEAETLQVACDPASSIQAGEVIKIFNPMLKDTEIRHGEKKFNVYFRWNCIPKNAKEIDIAVHFHGYNKPDAATIYRTAELSGLDLSKRANPTLCIMPLGKSDSSTSKNHSFPFFTSNAEGLQQLIDYSLKEFAAYFRLPDNTFTKKRLILTAHSGGGKAVNGVLNHKKYAVDEVHLFDATYFGSSEVIAWVSDKIKNNPQTHALRVLYRPCTDNNWKYTYDEKSKKEDCHTSETETHARRIEVELNKLIPANSPLLKQYRVEQTNVPHNDIPNTFGGQLLGEASVDLVPTPTKPSGKPACCPTFPDCVCRGKPTAKSLAFYNENEVDYFADREANFRDF